LKIKAYLFVIGTNYISSLAPLMHVTVFKINGYSWKDADKTQLKKTFCNFPVGTEKKNTENPNPGSRLQDRNMNPESSK
jgi:hypothetical protein